MGASGEASRATRALKAPGSYGGARPSKARIGAEAATTPSTRNGYLPRNHAASIPP